MQAEVIDLPSGTLILTREGRKLIKVTLSPVLRAKSYRVSLDFRPDMPSVCMGCGDDLDLDSTGMMWEDQGGIDICKYTFNGLHIPENVDLPF